MIPESPHVEGGPEYVPLVNFITFLLVKFILVIVGLFVLSITADPSVLISGIVLSIFSVSLSFLYHYHMDDIHPKYAIGIGGIITLIMAFVFLFTSMPEWARYVWLIPTTYGIGLFIGPFIISIKRKY